MSGFRWRGGAHQLPDEVAPAGIGAFDQLQLPEAPPFLDPPLADERPVAAGVDFEPDEAVHAVARGEALPDVLLVLPHPPGQVFGRADIQRPVPAAREEIGVEGHRSLRVL